MPKPNSQGLRFARVMMVLSSLSPLFLLWAIRGVHILPDIWFVVACLTLILLPNGILYLRITTARRQKDTKTLTIGMAEDHRDHLLVYLFAFLLPLYASNFTTWREFAAAMSAFVFIVFLFWHLNMHYMNLLFALFGYRVFTITPPDGESPLSGRERFVLITKRCYVHSTQEIRAFRLSDTVYFEQGERV